ncbi:MAG: cell division protein FtsL [Tractidigestivibacter sp.]|jgi:cell division protein FtsL|uniref:cell division protein FtsL n=1 Tax=Tractidigestivibacter sp. TaxID=2847320 RepID=UPI003D8AF3E2
MRYQGSEALNEAGLERRRANRATELEPEQSPSFSVVPGGGLDARARAGVSQQFLLNIKRFAVCFAVFISLCFGRVYLSTATVTALKNNATLKEQITDVQADNDNLQVERSVLSSSSRINTIATQNYGMVLSTDREVIDLSSTDATTDATTYATTDTTADSTDTTATDTATTDDSTTNGDAAQASDASQSSSSEA